jgi:hypothetical protein
MKKIKDTLSGLSEINGKNFQSLFIHQQSEKVQQE